MIALVLAGIAAATDLVNRTVPNILVITAGIVAVAWLGFQPGDMAFQSLVAAAGITATLVAFRCVGTLIFRRPGLGMGDVKLSIVLGLLLQWHVFPVIYLGACLAAVFGLVGIWSGRLTKRSRLPFVPFITISLVSYGLASFV